MVKSASFRVQSHVLKLLGDELIGHDRLAIFELVKNAYDADAREVTVTVDLFANPPKIVVKDNGIGMSAQTIEDSWLEIGTDSKRKSGEKTRTELGRLPLGEKGVGRLAVQKLGEKLTLWTKRDSEFEQEFTIDWQELIDSSRYLGNGLKVEINENQKPKRIESSQGTLIEISRLHRQEWSKRDIRDLYRLVSSLNNPFQSDSSFKVELLLPGREDEIKDLPTLNDMLNSAVWRFKFDLDEDGKISWQYHFNPPKFKGLKSRSESKKERLPLLEADPDEIPIAARDEDQKSDDNILVTRNDLQGIGPISGEIYAFHRRDEILRASGSPQQIKKWLDNQTGVRVYRDNLRVFNYGEPREDWLGLDARRINRPAGKLGTQSVIAQVSLSLASSGDLKEKTNREGFDENAAYGRFQRIVLSIFDLLQREHSADRSAIDKAIKGDDAPLPIKAAMESLDALGKRHKIEKEVKPILQSIKEELKTFQEVMVSSGLAGMNLALIFHEIVHSIERVQRRLQAGAGTEEVKAEITHLRKLLDTFKPLLQRDPPRKVGVADLVARATGMHADRFTRHNVVLSNWTSDAEKKHDFTVTVPRGLVVAAISNAIDNAIYWTRYRQERDQISSAAAVLVLSNWDKDSGGLIAVVDNGPGLQLPRDLIGKPFSSSRPGGMGLGLFYCKTVMETIGGKLELLDVSELRDIVDVPAAYDGIAAIFSFRKE